MSGDHDVARDETLAVEDLRADISCAFHLRDSLRKQRKRYGERRKIHRPPIPQGLSSKLACRSDTFA